MPAPDTALIRRYEQRIDESTAANAQRAYDYATHVRQQCGQPPPALYTVNSRLAAKLQAISGYPVVDLTAHQVISGPTNQPAPRQ